MSREVIFLLAVYFAIIGAIFVRLLFVGDIISTIYESHRRTLEELNKKK